MPDFIGSYRLEVEALLTWYPTRSTAALKEVRIRGHTSRYSTQDKIFELAALGEIHHSEYYVGQEGTDEPIAPNNGVVGFTDVWVDMNINFNVECTLIVGMAKRVKTIQILPDTRIPFMINVVASENDHGLSGTSAVLQGVIVATQRVGVSLSLLASEINKLSSRGG
jgi:hypothetical protein